LGQFPTADDRNDFVSHVLGTLRQRFEFEFAVSEGMDAAWITIS
jgi:hypothetical protein